MAADSRGGTQALHTKRSPLKASHSKHPTNYNPTTPLDQLNAPKQITIQQPGSVHLMQHDQNFTSIQAAAPRAGVISGRRSPVPTHRSPAPNMASSSVNYTMKGRHSGGRHASRRFLTGCLGAGKHTSHRVPPPVTSQDSQKGRSIKEEKKTKQEAIKEHGPRPAGRS